MWSNIDIEQEARSYDDALTNIGKDGQKEKPIIDFIPFSRFLPDMLHANLRISEALLKKVFNDIAKLDKFDDLNPHMRQNYLSTI